MINKLLIKAFSFKFKITEWNTDDLTGIDVSVIYNENHNFVDQKTKPTSLCGSVVKKNSAFSYLNCTSKPATFKSYVGHIFKITLVRLVCTSFCTFQYILIYHSLHP